MSGAPKKNGKPLDGKRKSSRNGRNGKGQFAKGNVPTGGWVKGKSGNPAGYKSLGSLIGQALREELTSDDGKVKVKAIERFARNVVKWSHEEKPDKAYTQRQLLAMKAILDRLDPVAIKIEHEHSGKVAVGLTPAATAFQEACGAFAHEHDRTPTIKELREIRNGLQVTDADLGINGHS